MNIKKKVDSIVRTHKTRNPFEIIKGLNAIVLFVNLDGIRGFYQYFQRNNIIYINESLSDHEKEFVCAHELGHMFLHKDSNALYMDTHTHLNTNKYEIEADKFAMELLIDDKILIDYQRDTTEKLAQRLGYNEELINLRLH